MKLATKIAYLAVAYTVIAIALPFVCIASLYDAMVSAARVVIELFKTAHEIANRP